MAWSRGGLLQLRTQRRAQTAVLPLCMLINYTAFLSRKAFPPAGKLTMVILDKNANCPFLQLHGGKLGGALLTWGSFSLPTHQLVHIKVASHFIRSLSRLLDLQLLRIDNKKHPLSLLNRVYSSQESEVLRKKYKSYF